jgi:hypothetical protein
VSGSQTPVSTSIGSDQSYATRFKTVYPMLMRSDGFNADQECDFALVAHPGLPGTIHFMLVPPAEWGRPETVSCQFGALPTNILTTNDPEDIKAYDIALFTEALAWLNEVYAGSYEVRLAYGDSPVLSYINPHLGPPRKMYLHVTVRNIRSATS